RRVVEHFFPGCIARRQRACAENCRRTVYSQRKPGARSIGGARQSRRTIAGNIDLVRAYSKLALSRIRAAIYSAAGRRTDGNLMDTHVCIYAHELLTSTGI